LNINRDDSYGFNRSDSKVPGEANALNILEMVAETCFMPLTWGGRIKSIGAMRDIFSKGADKVCINTEIYRNPKLLSDAAQQFGIQSIVASIDVYKDEKTNEYNVYIDCGRENIFQKPQDWAKYVEDLGAGEILLQSVNRDGKALGYDLELIKLVSESVSIPVIACSGVGDFSDYSRGIQAGASAAAAANIWHFREMTDRLAKESMKKNGINVRQI
jgi:imidazole glycerol-phosphate synthase subunit HisF